MGGEGRQEGWSFHSQVGFTGDSPTGLGGDLRGLARGLRGKTEPLPQTQSPGTGDISGIQRTTFLPRENEAGGSGREQEQEMPPAFDVRTAILRSPPGSSKDREELCPLQSPAVHSELSPLGLSGPGSP